MSDHGIIDIIVFQIVMLQGADPEARNNAGKLVWEGI